MQPCGHCAGSLASIRSALLGLHRTSVLRHDELGAETLLNLLLRSYLADNLYDQVGLKICSISGYAVWSQYMLVCSTRCYTTTLCSGLLLRCALACRHSSCSPASQTHPSIPPPLPPPAVVQAERLRAKAQRPEASRSMQQQCRYLYYLGRIRAVQVLASGWQCCGPLVCCSRSYAKKVASQGHQQRSSLRCISTLL